MSSLSLFLYGSALFYGLLGVGVLRRARKHSCRVCFFWQTCKERRLGIDGPVPDRCTQRSSCS
jgi:hypothetical protein